MKSITVTIPIPPSGCNPNCREHWRKRRGDIADAREDARLAAMAAVGENRNWRAWEMPWRRAQLLVRWFHPTKTLRDKDNIVAALKASIDGVVLGGILYDDDNLTWLPVERFVDKDDPRVELVFTHDSISACRGTDASASPNADGVNDRAK